MNMRIFKLAIAGLVLSTTFSSCKKEIINGEFGVNDETVNSQFISKGKSKTDAQYISILYTNIYQKAISVNELVKTENVIYSIGDRALAYEMIVSNYMNSPSKVIPSDVEMRANIDLFIRETYRRFYVRDPNELELTFFRNYIEANPNITSEMIYTSFATSEEYRFY